MTPVTYPAATRLSSCTDSLKGEPKALGTVQIMTGIMTFILGIVLTMAAFLPGTISGITLWGSLMYISSGSLSVASVNHPKLCVVKASMVMNVISAVVALMELIILSVDMLFNPYYVYSAQSMWYGTYSVLFVFALLEFIISICTSVFACKATSYGTTHVMFSQQLIHTQPPVHTQEMDPPPKYNPAYYNQQVPQQPSATENVYIV